MGAVSGLGLGALFRMRQVKASCEVDRTLLLQNHADSFAVNYGAGYAGIWAAACYSAASPGAGWILAMSGHGGECQD